jgi:hypothetical protein
VTQIRDSEPFRDEIKQNCDQEWFYWRIVDLYETIAKLNDRLSKIEKAAKGSGRR